MNRGGQAPAGAALQAEGSMSAAPPPPNASDSFSRLPLQPQGSQVTEDDEDEVIEQDPTGEQWVRCTLLASSSSAIFGFGQAWTSPCGLVLAVQA
jgi:hypothetical protein